MNFVDICLTLLQGQNTVILEQDIYLQNAALDLEELIGICGSINEVELLVTVDDHNMLSSETSDERYVVVRQHKRISVLENSFIAMEEDPKTLSSE